MAAQYLLTSGELDFLDRELLIQQDELHPTHSTGAAQECISATHATEAASELLPSAQLQGAFLQSSTSRTIKPTATYRQDVGAQLAQHLEGRKLSSNGSGHSSITHAKQVSKLPLSCSRALLEVEKLEQQLGSCMASDPVAAASLQASMAQHYNQAATQVLDAGHNALAKTLLDKALLLCEVGSTGGTAQSSLMATTLNNMACYHKRAGDLRTALILLQQAAQLEVSHRDAAEPLTEQQVTDTAHHPPPHTPNTHGSTAGNLTDPGRQEAACASPRLRREAADLTQSIASTHLNLSTVLSALGRHAEAVQVIQNALKQLCSLVGLQSDEVVAWAVTPRRPRPHSHHTVTSKPSRAWGGSYSMRSLNAGKAHDSSCSMGLPHASRECSLSVGSTAPSSCHSQEGLGAACTSRTCSEEGGIGMAEAHHTASNIGTRLAQLPKQSACLLAMCMYNHAVEYEHQRDVHAALRMYTAAAGLAAKLCGRDSAHAQQFNKTLQVFKSRHRQAGSQDAFSNEHRTDHDKLQCSSSSSIVITPVTSQPPQPAVKQVAKAARHRSAGSRLHALMSAGSVASRVSSHRTQKLQAACTPLRAAYAPSAMINSTARVGQKAGQLALASRPPCCPPYGVDARCMQQGDMLLTGSKQGEESVNSNRISGSLDARVAAHKLQLHSLFTSCHETDSHPF